MSTVHRLSILVAATALAGCASVSPDEYGMDGTFSVYVELTEKGLSNKNQIISNVQIQSKYNFLDKIFIKVLLEEKSNMHKIFFNQLQISIFTSGLSLILMF